MTEPALLEPAPEVSALQAATLPEILRCLLAGESMGEICRREGMPDRVTVHRWCKADPAVDAQIMEAREVGYMDRAERVVDEVRKCTDPHKARVVFDAERWFLGKLSNAFADRPVPIGNQTNNFQVNIDARAGFGRIAEFMDRAAASLSSGASSTRLVAGDGPAGPDNPEG